MATMQAMLAAALLPPRQQPLPPTSYGIGAYQRPNGTRFAPLPHIHATIANSIVRPLINDGARIHDGNVSFTDPFVHRPHANAATVALR